MSESENLKTFGTLSDDGDSGDGKRTFIVDDNNDSWKRISIEIDTDDCDSEHARAFKRALISLWNNQS